MTLFRSTLCATVGALALIASVPSTLAATTASQQVSADPRTDERLARLEVALRDLQGAVYAVEGQRAAKPVRGVPTSVPGALTVSAATASDTALRLDAIEQALAELTGRVESLAFRLERLAPAGADFGGASTLPAIPGTANTYDPATDDPTAVDPSLTLPPAGAATAGPTSLVTAPAAASVLALPDDPDAAYAQAYNSVLAADYPAAESALEAFVEKFPDAAQTPEAKYLLGEVYLATGANGDAARVLLDHVSTYKNDPRSPEAYLKLGVAFARLDRREEACRVFKAGEQKFPDLSDRLKRRYADEKAAAGCR